MRTLIVQKTYGPQHFNASSIGGSYGCYTLGRCIGYSVSNAKSHQGQILQFAMALWLGPKMWQGFINLFSCIIIYGDRERLPAIMFQGQQQQEQQQQQQQQHSRH